ncbi:MAG: hypothetical protein AVDCRST_MAG50-3100 [uncultured Acidimicrobiales bacterium]|uniref:DUF58 domain-containing protein n=1 Tax=uncultured Acidimicrobiales bacterium TaxID=310071 RepID=A0A6J4J1A2_9ACTN|nr:MAG: hypothetical protein AVDCRST_MAG50-3100 [uncultured Acidimicrobiales bacterium]
MAPPLLDPALLGRLESLQLRSRRRLAGQLAGEHRSPRHGSSLDFADFREYHPGDDFRRIDYHLLARLDVVLIKLFEAEDDLHLRLLVDTSASMAEGGKLRQAARLAAALGFVALVRRDAVTVHTFPLDRPPARFVGRGAAPALFARLEALVATGDTRFAAAATQLLSRPGPPGLTVVLSDLLTPEWEAGLTRLPARGGDVTVVHVLAEEDLHPPLEGDVELVDSETGRRVAVSLSADSVRAYERTFLRWADAVELRCRSAGVDYLRVASDADIEPVLLGSWRRAGVLR